jgi:hypothetical protein
MRSLARLIWYGQLDKANSVLEKHPALLHCTFASGLTPLTCAATRGHYDMSLFLLEMGAPINQVCVYVCVWLFLSLCVCANIVPNFTGFDIYSSVAARSVLPFGVFFSLSSPTLSRPFLWHIFGGHLMCHWMGVSVGVCALGDFVGAR